MTAPQHPIYNMSKEEILSQLLRKECGYYKAILEITRLENEKLEHGHPLSEIRPLLEKKKILLSCINEIDSALSPLKKYWINKTDRSDKFSQQVKAEVSDLNDIVKAILQQDLTAQKMLETQLHIFREKQKKELAAIS